MNSLAYIRKILLLGLLYNASIFAQPSEKLIIILDWFANPDHAPLFVAEQQGFFKAQQLDVKIVAPGDPAQPPKLAAAKKADLAITYEPQFILQKTQGLPLAKVATLIATPLDCLVVDAQDNIKHISDLKGKKIGYSTDTTALVTLKAMLHQAGLSVKDVTLINVHYNLTQALLTHQVDAITGVMRNFELAQLKMAGFTPRAFYPEEHHIPAYDELILVTHSDNKTDPRLKRFIAALESGTQYLINHPEESWALFAKNHPELNNELNRQAWFATLPRFALRPGAVDQEREQRLEQFLRKHAFSPPHPSPLPQGERG